MQAHTYVPHQLVRIGELHQKRRARCQDHAVVVDRPAGVGLVVADGVSLYTRPDGRHEHSRNEVGAVLAVEAAAWAIADVFDGRAHATGPSEIMDRVAERMFTMLHPIWVAQTDLAARALQSTLLIALVTADMTTIYASGDGYWGVLLPVVAGSAGPLRDITGEGLVEATRSDCIALHGCKLGDRVKGLATSQARFNVQAVRAAFRPVLHCPRPVLSVHVATDGLRDEEAIRMRLRRSPVREPELLRGMLQRPEGCDDLGLAFAVTAQPGMLGEDLEVAS